MQNLIEDILTVLIEEANEIKAGASDDFKKGKLFGYYESISRILNQTEAFGMIDKLPRNLQEYKPECLLDEIN